MSGPSDPGAPPPRTAIVGVGAITSQGASATDLWERVRRCEVAIRPVRHLSMDGYRTTLAGEVEGDPSTWPEHPDIGYPEGYHDRALEFALIAAHEAVNDSGAALDGIDADRWGVVLGTCNAGLLSGRHWYQARLAGKRSDPRLLTYVPPQALAEAVAGAYRLRGPVLSIDTACAAGANAVGYGAELIRMGRADAVLCGGTDALSDVLISGFNCLESLSPEPAAPYSKDRLGLSLGEGSGMLVVVRLDLADELGIPILAEVAGYGLSSDGYHPTAPHPEGLGASRAIRAALRAAGVAPEEIAYVNSHGTGTAKNDPAETLATKLGLGDAVKSAAVSSTKSMIGHLLGAAGAVEAIVTVKALQHQVAPPTANFTEPDPDCDLDYVPNASRPLPMRAALSNNFAFGGANATVVLTRDRPTPPPAPPTDRVVVTGLGMLTPAGGDPAAVWDAVADGRDVLDRSAGYGVGRVEVDVKSYLTPKEKRRMDRLGVLSVIAAKLALRDADWDPEGGGEQCEPERIGVVLGTGVGPMEAMEAFARPLFDEGPGAANPAVFPNTVYNAAAGQVSMRLGVVGPTTTITAGHAAGASAMMYAGDLLAADHADAMLAIASDTLTDTVLAAYGELGTLGPTTGLSESGIAVMMERQGAARRRGARVLGELGGCGIAGDGIGVGRWDTGGTGLERAVRIALDDAGLTPADIDVVWSASFGLSAVDQAEAAALERVFGGGDRPTVRTPKPLLGEPIGAGGTLAAGLAIEGWSRGDALGPSLILSASLGGTYVVIVLLPPSGLLA